TRSTRDWSSDVCSSDLIEQSAETQLQAILESLNRDRDRKLLQERLLADARQSAEVRLAVPTSAAEPSAAGATSPVEQLETARKTLRELEWRLKPELPDFLLSECQV